MAFPFVDAFSQGPSPIQDDAIRDRLQQAILDHDSRSFRETLLAAHPELAGQHRLYGVFAMTPDGMVPIMVDETGERGGEGYVIARGTPIDLLNVQVKDSEMIVTMGEHVWKTNIGPS